MVRRLGHIMNGTENTAVALFSHEGAALTFFDKKGAGHTITAEGALYKGGAALTALKDAALESALIKAGNGRYRPASDILCAAFPAIGKAAEKLIGAPWANKSTMATLIAAVRRAEPGKNGFTKKQGEARMLVGALLKLPAFAETVEAETVEA